MASSKYLQDGGKWSQRDQRRGQMFRDQHGRRYHSETEIKTGHPCGPIQAQFTAPLMPPQMYIELSKDPERPYDITINYTRWKADLRAAHAEWQQRGEKLARLVHGDAYNADKPFGRQVLEELGPRPQHVEPVMAAEQGNKYVLGLTDRVDVRLFAMLQEDQPKVTAQDEPDFSQVVEADDDLDALDEEEETRKEKIRAADRERKRLKREAASQAAQAA